MRIGLDRNTGKILTSWAHCAQSIAVIVSTVIGSRVMCRDFGCDSPALQDRPQSPNVLMQHFSKIAEALRRWEPGFKLTKITVLTLSADGGAGFQISGNFYEDGHLGIYGTPTRVSAAYDVAGLLMRAA